jgi:dihydrofolate synthase/folylpolyglutamate synthase
LKPGVPVVVAEQRSEARDVILARATESGCRVVDTSADYDVDSIAVENGRARGRISEAAYGWRIEVTPSLPGKFQLQNALNAIATARLLQKRGFRISDQAIAEGIASTVWPGRLEKLQAQPDVYLDGAHNPAAARELSAFCEQNLAGRRIFLVYGALRDKAVDEIAGVLFPRAEQVIITEPRTSRAISAPLLASITSHHAASSVVIADAEQAFDYALSKAGPEDAIFVTGSLYLVGQLRHYWKQNSQVAAG